MDAAGLFGVDLAGAGQVRRVTARGGFGEEAVGVEVRAPQRHRIDHRIGSVSTQTQRNALVSRGRRPVDHGPFVQSEAVEPRRSRRGRGQQVGDESHSVRAPVKIFTTDRDPVVRLGVAGARQVAPGVGPLERHAESGVPHPQLARTQAVVGEQEVVDRMGDAGTPPREVGLQKGVDAGEVGALALEPVARGEPRIRPSGEPRIRVSGEPRIRVSGEPRIRHGGCRHAPCPPGPRRGLRARPPR